MVGARMLEYLEAWPQRAAHDGWLVLDGGTGTALTRRGVTMDRQAWSGLAALTHPDLLRDVHRTFATAGADVLTTNTFASARFLMAAAGCDDRVQHNVRRAVALAREAAVGRSPAPLVAGSLSNLPPAFDVTAYPSPAREYADYRELACLLAEAGVDLLLLEMMEDTVHAPRAFKAALATGCPVWVGVSVRLSDAGELVAYDIPEVPLASVLDALLTVGRPDAMTVMHSPANAVMPALAQIRARYDGPIGAYPELEGDLHSTPTAFAAAARAWLEAGATILGGCCGATPAHIAALARLRARRGA